MDSAPLTYGVRGAVARSLEPVSMLRFFVMAVT